MLSSEVGLEDHYFPEILMNLENYGINIINLDATGYSLTNLYLDGPFLIQLSSAKSN